MIIRTATTAKVKSGPEPADSAGCAGSAPELVAGGRGAHYHEGRDGRLARDEPVFDEEIYTCPIP
jgi:hypothetical protein